MKRIPANKSPIRKAYILLEAYNTSELANRYLKQDQKIITSRITDYHDRKLVTSKIRKILENVDARILSKDERYERRLILWLWYHHAISYAVWGYKDRRRAQKYSSLSLKYQPKKHPNKITRLLYLLVRDRYSDARKWTAAIRGSQKTTAVGLLKFYKKGGFFT